MPLQAQSHCYLSLIHAGDDIRPDLGVESIITRIPANDPVGSRKGLLAETCQVVSFPLESIGVGRLLLSLVERR
jgi:hypothetical protein